MSSTALSQRHGASQEAIEFHYDVGNDFYRLWLDEGLVYSCALWESAKDLEEAQLAKIDYHVAQARARGASRVLDIGCGWGANIARLVRTHGVGHAVGITLSRRQAAWAERILPVGAHVEVCDWRDYRPAEPFDALISIGAFEHFVDRGCSPEQKVRAYRAFFERCHQLTVPGAVMSLQTIYLPDDSEGVNDFIVQSIFPDSNPPALRELIESVSPFFELKLFRDDREDYARTCNEWLHRLRKRRAEGLAVVGPEVVARYERYLGMSAIGFHTGRAGLARLTLRRREVR